MRGGEWIVDSGSSFHIVSPADMTTAEKRRIYALGNPVPLNTAQGEATVTKAVTLVPFKTGTENEFLIMPYSPALLSLGQLCMDDNCSFVWNAGENFNADIADRISSATRGHEQSSAVAHACLD